MAAAGTIVNLSSTISAEGEAFLPDSGRPSRRPLFVRRGRTLDGHPGARHGGPCAIAEQVAHHKQSRHAGSHTAWQSTWERAR